MRSSATKPSRFLSLPVAALFGSVLLVALSPSAARAAPDAQAPAVAVLDMEARGATPVQAHAVTLAVVRGLRQLDVFPVLSAEDVRQLLAIERSRQLLGTEGESELGPMRDALGARYMVAGSVTQLGTTPGGNLQVEIRLLDTAGRGVISQKSAGPAPITQLARELPALAQELAAPLLEGAQGELLLRVSEEAAEVRVGDVLRGSTPLQEPLKLPRGTHRLEVRKDGFIAQLRPVKIEPERTAVEEIRLAPSPDYENAWRQRHRRLRTAAWLTTGAAAVMLGGAVAIDRGVESRYQTDFLPRRAALAGEGGTRFSGEAQARYQGCLRSGRLACQGETDDLARVLGRDQGLSIGLLGAGVATGGIATWLWLTGEDPNRYGRIVLAPSVGGGSGRGFALSGRF